MRDEGRGTRDEGGGNATLSSSLPSMNSVESSLRAEGNTQRSTLNFEGGRNGGGGQGK